MAAQDYLDFELRIEWRDDQKLSIKLVSSPVGSASIDIDPPVSDDEVAAMARALNAAATTPTDPERGQMARTFGDKLFQAAFSGPIEVAYRASLKRAAPYGLRIRLNLDKAGKFAGLPWELLRDSSSGDGDGFLCLSPKTQVMRSPGGTTSRSLQPVSFPLMVLTLIAPPSDGTLMNVEGEWRAFEEASRVPRSRGLLQIDRLENGRLTSLQRGLGAGTDYQILQYIGMAAFDEASRNGQLALENTASRAASITGEGLAHELADKPGIRLLVLCARPADATHDPVGDVAAKIAAGGMPAIVVIPSTLADNAAQDFASEFYSALAEGQPIEVAMATARREMARHFNTLDWARPVLYLRSATGILFPRRSVGTISRGGLVDLLRARAPILIGIAAVLLVALFAGTRLLPKPPIATRTPIPTTAPTIVSTAPPTSAPTVAATATVSNVDLIVSRVTYNPPNPGPGDLVTVNMVIRNIGTTSAGPFKVAWFASAGSGNPSIVVQVGSLSPGINLNVQNIYIFGKWGTFSTQAFVNYENSVPETNTLNNITAPINLTITPDHPFAIDFTLLPDISTIVTTQPLVGDEYKAWGFHISPDPNCAGATMTVDTTGTENHLVIAGTGASCSVIFKSDNPIGGARIDFTAASTADTYALELDDSKGNRIDSRTRTNVGIGAVSITDTIQSNDLHQVVFRGPRTLTIQKITFTAPNTAFPTPTRQP